MITKFKTIKNLAVFQNFVWDNSVLDKKNKAEEFKKINIIYGRNYSGKTTLSRIVRALDKGEICNKYENPEFEVSIKNLESSININNLNSHQKTIRVFNKDFVKENLRFFDNPDESNASFAMPGENVGILEEIDRLQSILGKKKESEESKETGFYLELKNAREKLEKSKKDYENEEPTNLTWAEGDTWYGWTYNPDKKRYYFDDIGNESLMGLWEDQWLKEADEQKPL